jgi:hypothetical protein
MEVNCVSPGVFDGGEMETRGGTIRAGAVRVEFW